MDKYWWNRYCCWNWKYYVYIFASTFVNFSRFTLANVIGGVNPLPIELLSFDEQKTDQTEQVDWSTAGEKNTNRFEIERSSDGINFEKIQEMKAVGNSSSVNSYQFIDCKPFDGLNYYRLKQVDNNNAYQFGEDQVVDFSNTFHRWLFVKVATITSVPLSTKMKKDQSCLIPLDT